MSPRKRRSKAQKFFYRGTRCFACGADGKLSVVAVLDEDGIPPGEPGHSIGYSHILIAHCEECGCGQVERLDHDCFDWEDVWDQYEWYQLSKSDAEKLLKSLESCPDPMSPECRCDIHVSLYNSVKKLPTSWWHWAFEDDRHKHKVSLKWTNGLPELKLKQPRAKKKVKGET